MTLLLAATLTLSTRAAPALARHFLLSSQAQIAILGLTAALFKGRTHPFKSIKMVFILTHTLVWLTLLYRFSVWDILAEANALLCVVVPMGSVAGVYYLTRGVQCEDNSMRKVFHVGPVVIVPCMHWLNPFLLQVVLAGGFYLLLSLQIYRYLGKRHCVALPYFAWMQRFNGRREEHFWFTHLFLSGSLLLSYTQHSINPHTVLLLIAADGMAALVGQRIGTTKLYRNKSLEGLAAFCVTYFLAASWTCEGSEGGYARNAATAFLAALAQLYSGDADNIVPLLCCLCLAS